MAEYLSPIAIALYAPGAAKPVGMDRLQDLSDLIRAVGDGGPAAVGLLVMGAGGLYVVKLRRG